MTRPVVRTLLGVPLVLVATMAVVSGLLAMLPGGESTWSVRMADNIATAMNLFSATSQTYQRPAVEVIGGAAVRSGVLILSTAVFLVLVGGLLGLRLALRPEGRIGSVVRFATEAVSTMPVLLWATLVFLVGAAGYGVVLADTRDKAVGETVPIFAAAIAALFLGDRLLADISRNVQLTATAALGEPHMRTVRAFGLGVTRHVVQTMVPPVAEFLAARIMVLISAAIVIESVFEIQGLGLLVRTAVQRGADPDVALVLGSSAALVAIGLVGRICCMAAVGMADPRPPSLRSR